MSVIYLTTHVQEDDFASCYSRVSRMPNPAGENFHGKLLRALALVEKVHAYCLVPTSLGKLGRNDFESDEIHYSYIYGPTNRYLRALTLPSKLSKRIAKEHQDKEKPFIIYDPLNAILSLTAKKLSALLHAPRIAILTDEIRNITGVSESYAKRIHDLTSNADASIALTHGLVDSYGLLEKPHYIQPAYVEEEPVEPYKADHPYLYYGGALFVKDGTKDLIDAFNALHPDYDLIISGHGNYEEEVRREATANPRIKFLGQVDKKEHFALIKGAALCLNPRRYNATLDALAVPSKVMEYLTYGNVIASTLTTPLRADFGEAINWIEGDFLSFMQTHLDADGKLINLRQNDAKSLIVEMYGKNKSAFNLQRFLKNLDASGFRR